MRRSRDDRMLAGVCGGLARYLDVDPVIVRVVVAALTIVGGIGIVFYLAAWLLVPEEGSDTSIVGRHLPGDRDERTVRTIGFALAAVLAVVLVADAGPGPGWPFPWPLVAIAFLLWFMFRSGRGPDTKEVPEASAASGATAAAGSPRTHRPSRGDGSLAWLTTGAGLIVAGVLWLVDRGSGGVEWPDYVAAELAVVGAGTLLGTWLGNGRRLIPLGVLLAVALLISTQLPTLTAGELRQAPVSGTELRSDYVLGAGEVRLDLTGIADPATLDGRTVSIRNGMGQVVVIVPDDVDVTVAAHVDFGHVQLFTREVGGWGSTLAWQDDDDSDPNLRLVIDQSFGETKVMHP